jgi:hypothetical protein
MVPVSGKKPRQEVSPPSALPRRAGALPDGRSFLGAGGGVAGGGRGSDRRRAAAHGAVNAYGMAPAPRAAAAGDGVAEVVLISRVPRPRPSRGALRPPDRLVCHRTAQGLGAAPQILRGGGVARD